MDGRAEITGADRDLARMLLRLGKPISLAVNKADTAAREDLAHEFYSLGIRDIFPVSAEHGIGVDALLDHVTAGFAAPPETEPAEEPGSERHQGGHHRPAQRGQIDAAQRADRRGAGHRFAHRRHHARCRGRDRDRATAPRYIFVDTAGIRRKGKTKLMAEKLSVVMARRNIRMAHVVLLVLDAAEGVLGQDATIAGYAHEGGRALIVCVNKWDEMRAKRQERIRAGDPRQVQVPGIRARRVSSRPRRARASSAVPADPRGLRVRLARITTGELNRFVEQLALRGAQDLLHHAGVHPPAHVRAVHRPGRPAALFPRAISGQPDPQTFRLPRDTHCTKDEGQGALTTDAGKQERRRREVKLREAESRQEDQRRQADYLHDDGLAAFQSGDIPAAARLLKRAIVLCPEHVPALALLGRIYVEAGQFAVALPHLRLLCRLRPDQPAAWYNCAIAHEQLGRLPEASSDLHANTEYIATEIRRTRTATEFKWNNIDQLTVLCRAEDCSSGSLDW